jgi:histidyl-tRNA synthetase
MLCKVPRGTVDILPGTVEKWQYIEDLFRKSSFLYGYKEIRTPIFEHTELFTRGIGETTDIVEKEMYTFLDKKGRSLTLRPEWTAPVMRSVIEHNLPVFPPLKLFYTGPIFRYERPQHGRYRQAHQLGIEVIGSESPLLDVEVIDLIFRFYKNLGLKGLSVSLNTIGCAECRPASRQKIIEFCRNNLDELCDNCKSRFERNPFRILDCKNEGCRKFACKCPSTLETICEPCKDHFNIVTSALNKINISYNIEHTLVRGLDYYTRTVFEVVSEDLGAQSSLCGGGRYDNLMEVLGGKPAPGVGVAAGLERVIMVMEKQGLSFGPSRGVGLMVIPLGKEASLYAVELVTRIREEKFISVDLSVSDKGLKGQLNLVNKMDIPFAIIIGDRELEQKEVIVRDMKKGEQVSVKTDDVINWLKKQSV